MTRPRSAPKRTAPTVRASPIIWQGASLDGAYFFRVKRMASGLQFTYAPIGTTETLAFKPITSPATWEQMASAHLMSDLVAVGTMPGTSLANRSIPRTAANAIPANGSNTAASRPAVRRSAVRGRVAVSRGSTVAAT